MQTPVIGSSRIAQEVRTHLGVPPATCSVTRFKDGNFDVRLGDLTGQDAYLVQSIGPPDVGGRLLETSVILRALQDAGARDVHLIMPYFGLALGDKKESFVGSSVRAKLGADLLEIAGGRSLAGIVIVDLHGRPVVGFFRTPVRDLWGYPVVAHAMRMLRQERRNIVLCAADHGALFRARAYGRVLGLPVIEATKERLDSRGSLGTREIVGTVRHRSCLILDDVVISGGTIASLAARVVELGADRVDACVTHAMLSKECVNRLKNSPIQWLFVSDSIEFPSSLTAPLELEVVSLAPLLAEAIRRITTHEPISTLMADFR